MRCTRKLISSVLTLTYTTTSVIQFKTRPQICAKRVFLVNKFGTRCELWKKKEERKQCRIRDTIS